MDGVSERHLPDSSELTSVLTLRVRFFPVRDNLFGRRA